MKINCNPCKKLMTVFFILGLCICMFLAGCSGKEKQSEEESQPEDKSRYDDIAGVYQAEIFMTEEQSVLLYLRILEDGSFVFARDTQFDSTEKGAGYLGKTKDGEEAFFYEIVNGSKVEANEYTAIYMVDEKGNIQFTSPMWFGSTSPKLVDENETVTYLCFVNLESIPEGSETEQTKNQETKLENTTTAEEETTEPATEAPIAPEPVTEAPTAPEPATEAPTTPEPATEAPVTPEPTILQSALVEGTYQGSVEKFIDAMNSVIHYDVTITFQNGNYNYEVNITLSGTMEYSGQESYSGSYSINGDSMSMTGVLSSGVIYGTSVTLTGKLSSYAGQQESVTVFQ